MLQHARMTRRTTRSARDAHSSSHSSSGPQRSDHTLSVVTTDAIILQAFPYGDTSRILRLLTRDFGVRSAMAKGATRPKSRYSGLLELFTEGSATLYLK